MLELNRIYQMDCLIGMQQLATDSIDCIVTDPPYGISFMGKEWDKVLPKKEIWAECWRVLKHGAFAFIMTSPRLDVFWRMGQMLEEVGFVVGFTPIFWCYLSGFPKGVNISKAIDKRGGNDPEYLRKFKQWFRDQITQSKKTQQQINEECGFTATSYYKLDGKDYWTSAMPTPEKWAKIKQVMGLNDEWDWVIKRYDQERGFIEPTGNLHTSDKTKAIKFSGKQLSNTPYCEKAKEMHGSYAGFQPKPAVEPILVVMKPLNEKTYVDQAVKDGKGVTWLDNGRIPVQSNEVESVQQSTNSPFPKDHQTKGDGSLGSFRKDRGEWTSGKGRFPANLLVSDNVLDTDTITVSSGGKTTRKKENGLFSLTYDFQMGGYGDSGSVSRCFDLDRWWEQRIHALPKDVQKVFPFFVIPKPSPSEKNKGLKLDSNIHPTIKPIQLMSYLVILGSRKGDLILDPFLGTGTTAIACREWNRQFLGFEIDQKYYNIAQTRLKPYMNQKRLDIFGGK